MEKNFKRVQIKDLVKGKEYYDIPSLDIGDKLVFVKRRRLNIFFKGNTSFYKVKNGLIRFNRIRLLNQCFYEHIETKPTKISARKLVVGNDYFDRDDEKRICMQLIAKSKKKLSFRVYENQPFSHYFSSFIEDENGLIHFAINRDLYFYEYN